jgi:hypothetical protein
MKGEIEGGRSVYQSEVEEQGTREKIVWGEMTVWTVTVRVWEVRRGGGFVVMSREGVVLTVETE